jgi:uncharacterized protein (TIGR02246 family)
MRSYIISIVLALTLALAACQPAPQQEAAPAPPTQAEVAAAINEVRGAYNTALNAGDAAAVAALFTDDAVSMPPNAPAAMGKEAIQANLQSRFEQATFEVTITQAEAVGMGEWAYGRGTYTAKITPKAGGAAIEDNGKYLNVLAHQPDGSWKIARHIWNSDNPLPGATKK